MATEIALEGGRPQRPRASGVEESHVEAADSHPQAGVSEGSVTPSETGRSFVEREDQDEREGGGAREQVDPGKQFFHQKGRGERTEEGVGGRRGQ